MTRRSRRELERELAALGEGASTATVREFVRDAIRGSFEVTFDDDRDRDSRVVVYRGNHYTIDVPAGDLPEWIDGDDLPVHV